MSFVNRFRLRMKERRAAMPGASEFKQAAIVYVALKSVIIFLTANYIHCATCGDTTFLRQAIHLILFSHFLWAGMRLTSLTIGLACVARGIAYMVNYFFKTTFLLYLPITGTKLSVLNEGAAGNSIFLVNSLLLFAIAGMIFRAVKARSSTSVEEEPESAPAELPARSF